MDMSDSEVPIAESVITKTCENGQNCISIYSWNVNGLKTIKNLNELLLGQESPSPAACTLSPCPDIIGFQETKLTRSQLTEDLAFIPGYSSYFTYSTNRSGYSGVGTYVKLNGTPFENAEGLTVTPNNPPDKFTLEPDQRKALRHLDNDGRTIMTQHLVQLPNGTQKRLTIFNVYCPRLRDDPSEPVDNTELKLLFHQLLGQRAKEAKDSGSFVIILGDLNICHTPLDQANDIDEIKNQKNGGPKPNQFQQWLTDLFKDYNFIDSYRYFYPTAPDSFTCWCTKTNSRANNYGTRLDYILIDNDLGKYLTDAQIHSNVMGSDHCPISVTFSGLLLVPSSKQPSLSTKWYPEFTGKQVKLSKFLVSKDLTQNKRPTVSIPVSNSKRSLPPPTKSKQGRLDQFFTKRPKLDLEVPLEAKRNEKQDEVNGMNPHPEPECAPSSQEPNSYTNQLNNSAKAEWKQLLKPTIQPCCAGHGEPCILRVVRKKGPNQGRKFWACPRGAGKFPKYKATNTSRKKKKLH